MKNANPDPGRGAVLGAVETFSLLAAFACTIPILPSNAEPISFFPIGIVAIILFAFSRLLRHWFDNPGAGKWLIWTVELIGFAVLAVFSDEIANKLLQS